MTPSYHHSAQVFIALAQYLGLDERLLAEEELQRDLGLQPLDLVLFVLRFDDSDELAFPFEQLDRARTVKDLVHFVASWLDDKERAEQRAALSHGVPKESGEWSLVDELDEVEEEAG